MKLIFDQILTVKSVCFMTIWYRIYIIFYALLILWTSLIGSTVITGNRYILIGRNTISESDNFDLNYTLDFEFRKITKNISVS